jgi:hypothetical protein
MVILPFMHISACSAQHFNGTRIEAIQTCYICIKRTSISDVLMKQSENNCLAFQYGHEVYLLPFHLNNAWLKLVYERENSKDPPVYAFRIEETV